MDTTASKTKYVLVSYEGDWADEVTVKGFMATTFDAWQETMEEVKEHFDKGGTLSHSIGSNEEIEYDQYRSWISDYKVRPLSEEEFQAFQLVKSLTNDDLDYHFYYPDIDAYFEEDDY
jgi:hypothetical protein